MTEPKVGDYCYYPPELFEVSSIVRHQLYRIVGVTSNKRYVVPLTQLQLPNIVDRAISVVELNGMHQRIEEQQKNIDNSEMLGTAGARLEEELWQLKLESQRLSDQLLATKRLLEYAGNQRESCRRQVKTLRKEFAEVMNVAETKTRECIALVDDRECLPRELENAEINIGKLRTTVRTEQTSKEVIQSRLEAINAQSPFSRPPNFYELLFLPQGAHNQYYPETFQNVCKALASGQGWSGGPIQNYSSGKKIMLLKMRRPVIFMTSTGLKKQRNI